MFKSWFAFRENLGRRSRKAEPRGARRQPSILTRFWLCFSCLSDARHRAPPISLHRVLMMKCQETQHLISSTNFDPLTRFWLWLALVCLDPLVYLHFAMTPGSGSARSSFAHRRKLSNKTLCMYGLSTNGYVKTRAERLRTLDTKL